MVMSDRSVFGGAFAVSLAMTVLPLWSAHYLPFVDLPQHLYLIHVLGHLRDTGTLYPEFFKARSTLTPYLGYYDAVWLLNRAMDLFHADAVFLSLVAVGT